MPGIAIMSTLGGNRVQLSNRSISDTNVGSPSVAGYSLTSTGKVTETIGVGSTTIGDWILPNGAAGANYECRATVNSGAVTTGTTGTWLALSSTRAWTCQQFSVGAAEANLTIEIRSAITTQVLASATVALSAVVF
jgi:hypothetical protein